MHPSLQAQWTELENLRTALVARVSALPVNKQSQRPQPNEFSPLDVLAHCILAEAFDLELIQKGAPDKTKPRFFFPQIVATLQKGRRVPSPRAMIPTEQLTLAEADRRWTEVRAQLKASLEDLPTPNAPLLKHPMMGCLSGENLLQVLIAHTRYHDIRFPS